MKQTLPEGTVLFRTAGDTRLYKSARFFLSLTLGTAVACLFFFALFLLTVFHRDVDAASRAPEACGITALVFLLLCVPFFLLALSQWRRANRIIESNHLCVRNDLVYGRATEARSRARSQKFSFPFSSVLRVSETRRRVEGLLLTKTEPVLCLHTAERTYELYGIADVTMAVEHLSYFIQ